MFTTIFGIIGAALSFINLNYTGELRFTDFFIGMASGTLIDIYLLLKRKLN